jgi:hypothetical protein
MIFTRKFEVGPYLVVFEFVFKTFFKKRRREKKRDIFGGLGMLQI